MKQKLVALALLAALALACGRQEGQSERETAAPKSTAALRVLKEGVSVPTPALGDMSHATAVAALFDLESAHGFIVATNSQGATLHLQDPATRYPKQELRVYLIADTQVVVGLVDRKNETLRGLSLSDVVEISWMPKPPSAANPTVLHLALGENRVALSDRDLSSLPQARLAGTGNKYKGALLKSLLEQHAPSYSEVEVLSKGEPSLLLKRADLEGENRIAILKLNRRGLLKLRVLRLTAEAPDVEQAREAVHEIRVITPEMGALGAR